MARLTMFSRFLITLLIVGGIFFGFKFLAPQFGLEGFGSSASEEASPSGDNTATTPIAKSGSGSTSAAPAPAPARASGTFNYTPPGPVNGKLKGVVEVGATGFNSFIIKVDSDKNWRLEKKNFGASLVYEKLVSASDIRSGLKNYIAEMFAYGVKNKDIHFVVSSGAKKVDIMDKIVVELKGLGFVVNTITADQEAKYGFKAAVPAAYANKAFMIDIGSGNTKMAWNTGGGVQTREAHGAKYFDKGVSDATVYKDVSVRAQDIQTDRRDYCFIIGGVPYELAKQGRKGEERFTVLNEASSYTAEGAKQKAGLNIYKSIADATGCREFIFDWDANFTIGFLLGLPY
jgi:hypothetical protein